MSNLPFVTWTVPVAPPELGTASKANVPTTWLVVIVVNVTDPVPPCNALPQPWLPFVTIPPPPVLLPKASEYVPGLAAATANETPPVSALSMPAILMMLPPRTTAGATLAHAFPSIVALSGPDVELLPLLFVPVTEFDEPPQAIADRSTMADNIFVVRMESSTEERERDGT